MINTPLRKHVQVMGHQVITDWPVTNQIIVQLWRQRAIILYKCADFSRLSLK